MNIFYGEHGFLTWPYFGGLIFKNRGQLGSRYIIDDFFDPRINSWVLKKDSIYESNHHLRIRNVASTSCTQILLPGNLKGIPVMDPCKDTPPEV